MKSFAACVGFWKTTGVNFLIQAFFSSFNKGLGFKVYLSLHLVQALGLQPPKPLGTKLVE